MKDRRIVNGVQRALLYIRVSTEEQALHGLSLPAQHEKLTTYAAENHLKVVGVYADEGVSARKRYIKRPKFMEMLDVVQKDGADLILFIKLDRWFRSVPDYYEVQRILDEHNVHWIATEEDYDTTTANGRLHLNIKLSIAQDECDRTSERIKFVFENKVQHGEVVSGKVPLGYVINNKRMEIDPVMAPIVQDIFQQYIALRSIHALRRYMINTHGIVRTYYAIRNMLLNERYIGRAHGHDDFCPPLIDPSTFERVHAIVEERSQRNSKLAPDWIYLFTGLIYCAECGNRLCAHTVSQKYIYYRCTRHEKLRLCPHNKRTNEMLIEDWLVHNLITQFEQYNLDLEAKASQPQKKVDEGKIKRKMEKLKDLYLNDLLDRETYERDYIALRDELRAANAILESLPKPVDIKAVSDALSVYSELSQQNKKEFWARTVSKIIITNEDDFFVVPISP